MVFLVDVIGGIDVQGQQLRNVDLCAILDDAGQTASQREVLVEELEAVREREEDADRKGAKMISMVLKTHAPIDVVFIMLGTNDAKRQFSTNSISLEKGIRTLMYRALNPENYRDGSKLPKFFVVCPPKMNVDGLKNERTVSNFGQAGFDILANTKPYLEKGCSGLNVEVIDTSAVAGSLDGIHMDEKGHKLVADALISMIKEL